MTFLYCFFDDLKANTTVQKANISKTFHHGATCTNTIIDTDDTKETIGLSVRTEEHERDYG